MSLQLTPVCEPHETAPSALDVALTLPVAGAPVFRLDDAVMGSPGMAKLISDPTVSDGRGALPIVRTLTSDGDGGKVLQLAGSRTAVGPITLRYRAHSVSAASDGGAREGLRHDATGIGGLGAAFLVLPESRGVREIRVEWLTGTCGNVETATTFTVGPKFKIASELEALRAAVYVAGHPRMLSNDDGTVHIRSTWLGTPAFDPTTASAWAARAYTAERAFFADDDPAPYHIFVRVLASMRDRSNGTGEVGSFLSAIGPATTWGPRLRRNIAHEMLHRWLGHRLRLAGPDGSAFWFTEGFDVYYSNLLMLRAKLISPAEYLDEVNMTVAWQFASEHAAASNDQIRQGFYADDVLAVVPYTRGALYAAELDATIRRTSRGRRSLDDVMRELYRAALVAPASAAGWRELPATAVRDAVHRELGDAGVARYDAVIGHGAMPDPPSAAFGSCFERVPRRHSMYQLGFDRRLPAIKLVPGSAAAKAGLVDGDEIVSVDSTRLEADTEAAVTVRRDGKERVFRYLPIGGKRDGFAWQRVASVPDARCGD